MVAGIADRADGDGQSNPLQERKVDVDIGPSHLEPAKTVEDGLQRLQNVWKSSVPCIPLGHLFR
jgi:hypothetical protein